MEEREREAQMAVAAQNATEAANVPDVSGLLSGLLGGLQGPQNASESGGGASGLSEGIGAVLRDPEMMAKLPDMLATLAPLMGGGGPGALSALGEGKEGGGGGHSRRVALLRALRPYLSPRRREAVDYMLKMDRMGGLFRGIGPGGGA